MITSYLSRLDRLPPPICLMLARDGRRKPIPMAEISRRSGLSAAMIRKIATLKSWAEVPVGDCESFRSACGITPLNERRHIEFLKRSLKRGTGMKHLSRRNYQSVRMMLNAIKPL